jgi:Dual specificity phosphatase, catalytic domain
MANVEANFAADLVEEGLYLGSVRAACAPLSTLRAHGITHVLTVGRGLPQPHRQLFSPLKYMRVNVHDHSTENLMRHFDETFVFLQKALRYGHGGITARTAAPGKDKRSCAVLVHCQAGVSRSASVVIAYLMRRDHLSAKHALALVRKARPRIFPNAGFHQQLQLYERLGNRIPSDTTHSAMGAERDYWQWSVSIRQLWLLCSLSSRWRYNTKRGALKAYTQSRCCGVRA